MRTTEPALQPILRAGPGNTLYQNPVDLTLCVLLRVVPLNELIFLGWSAAGRMVALTPANETASLSQHEEEFLSFVARGLVELWMNENAPTQKRRKP